MPDVCLMPDITIGCGTDCPINEYYKLKQKLGETLDNADHVSEKLLQLSNALRFTTRLVSEIYQMGYANEHGSLPDGTSATNLKDKCDFNDKDVVKKLFHHQETTEYVDTQQMVHKSTINYPPNKLSDGMLFTQHKATIDAMNSASGKVDEVVDQLWNLFPSIEQHLMNTPAHQEYDKNGLSHIHYFAATAFSFFEESEKGMKLLQNVLTNFDAYPSIKILCDEAKANPNDAVADLADILVVSCKAAVDDRLKFLSEESKKDQTARDPMEDPVIKSYLKEINKLVATDDLEKNINILSENIVKNASKIMSTGSSVAAAINVLEKNSGKNAITLPPGYSHLTNGLKGVATAIAIVKAAQDLFDRKKNATEWKAVENCAKLANSLSAGLSFGAGLYKNAMVSRADKLFNESFLYGTSEEMAAGTFMFDIDEIKMEYCADMKDRAGELSKSLGKVALVLSIYSFLDSFYEVYKQGKKGDMDKYMLAQVNILVAGIGLAGAFCTVFGATSAGALFGGVGAVAGLAVGLVAWYNLDHPLLEWIEDLPWGIDGYSGFFGEKKETIENQVISLYTNEQLFDVRVYKEFYNATGRTVYLNFINPTAGKYQLEVLIPNRDQNNFNLELKEINKEATYSTTKLNTGVDGAYLVTDIHERIAGIKRDGKTQYTLRVWFDTPTGHKMDDEITVVFPDPSQHAAIITPTAAQVYYQKYLPASSIVNKNGDVYLLFDEIKNGFSLNPRVNSADGCYVRAHLYAVTWGGLSKRRIALGQSETITGNSDEDIKIDLTFAPNDEASVLDGSRYVTLRIDFELFKVGGDSPIDTLESYELNPEADNQYLASSNYVNSI